MTLCRRMKKQKKLVRTHQKRKALMWIKLEVELMSFAPFVEEGNPVTDFEEPAALISFLRNSFPEEVKDNICIQDRSNRQ